MSSIGEESRTGRKGNEPRTANQSRQFTNSRDGTPSTQSGRKGGRTSQGPGKQIESVQNGSSTMTTPIQDEHIPLSGFNSAEVEGLLNRGFDAKAASYKSESKTPPGKSDSPWGMKSGSMANGKDFWLELRKQVTALQQSGGVSQGG